MLIFLVILQIHFFFTESEILTLPTIFWHCWLLPSSMASTIQPNSSGGCAPQNKWSYKLIDTHLSCQNTSCAERMHITSPFQNKQKGMDWHLVLVIHDLSVLLVFSVSWLKVKEGVSFLMIGPSFPCHYFPKNSLDPLLPPNKILYLYLKDQFCHNAALNREGKGISSIFSPSFLSTRSLFSTLMSSRKSFFKLGSGWTQISFYIRVVSHLNYLIYMYFKINVFLMINWPSIWPSEVGVLGYFSLSQTTI